MVEAEQVVEKAPLYDRLGGEVAVDAVVDGFYVKVLADNRVNGMFAQTDMKKLAGHQKAFITLALGGPNGYSGKNLREAHAKINKGAFPSEEHFNVIAELLAATLSEAGVGQVDIDEAIGIVASTKNDILGL